MIWSAILFGFFSVFVWKRTIIKTSYDITDISELKNNFYLLFSAFCSLSDKLLTVSKLGVN